MNILNMGLYEIYVLCAFYEDGKVIDYETADRLGINIRVAHSGFSLSCLMSAASRESAERAAEVMMSREFPTLRVHDLTVTEMTVLSAEDYNREAERQ